MNSRGGRSALIAIGVVALLVGGVWIGQGSNLLPGSVMSGDSKWLIIGLVVAVGGIVALVMGIRRPRRSRE